MMKNKQGVVKPFIIRPLGLQEMILNEGPTVNRMLIELEIECVRNAGKNNGKIIHTYDDFVHNGTSRKHINIAIKRLEHLGVIRKIKGRPGIGGYERPHMFTLTYLPTWNGKKWIPATNDWLRAAKRVVRGPVVVKRELRHVVPLGELRGSQEPADSEHGRSADKIEKTSVVKRELLSRFMRTTPPYSSERVWSMPTITEVTDPAEVAEIRRLFGGTIYQADVLVSYYTSLGRG
jgi:hypothetical protein